MHSATWKGPDPGWRMKTGRFRTKRLGMRHLAGNDFSNGFVCFGKRLIEIVVLGGTREASSTAWSEKRFLILRTSHVADFSALERTSHARSMLERETRVPYKCFT